MQTSKLELIIWTDLIAIPTRLKLNKATPLKFIEPFKMFLTGIWTALAQSMCVVERVVVL